MEKLPVAWCSSRRIGNEMNTLCSHILVGQRPQMEVVSHRSERALLPGRGHPDPACMYRLIAEKPENSLMRINQRVCCWRVASSNLVSLFQLFSWYILGKSIVFVYCKLYCMSM
ncbi:hypothetical protein AMECASPLE_019020 [Ameca splendens]|uniref:Uncharacterized protein n=1 Tax=Ameca splendens TaxID=208324 RepID=A0ABV1A9R1_9TELE